MLKNIKVKFGMLLVTLLAVGCFAVGIARALVADESRMLSFAANPATVVLDGTNPGSATVSLTVAQAGKLYNAQGVFSTTENDDDNGYFSASAFVRGEKIDVTYDQDQGYGLATGNFFYQYSKAGDGIDFAVGDVLYEMTYTVAANTPAGTYHLPIMIDAVITDNFYVYEEDRAVFAVVTVERAEAPKPQQTILFKDADNVAFTSITKKYGDEPFVVNVVPTEGMVVEYHPMDSSEGPHVVRTVPDSNMVEVDNVGEVEVCARVEETANYAETTACYTAIVTKRPLTISGAVVRNKDFDGTVTATVDNVSFTDRNIEIGQYTATGTFDTADAGNDKVVSVSVELTGDAANNYALASNTYNGAMASIAPYQLTDDDVALDKNIYSYEAGQIRPTVTVTAPGVYNGTPTLVEGQDYEVTYGENTEARTTGYAYVTGKGNYSTSNALEGKITKEFTITTKGIADSDIVAPNSVVAGHILSADEVSVVVNGRTLTRCANDGDGGCDYVLAINNNTGVIGDEIDVAVNGRNNYSGFASKAVQIVAKAKQTVEFSGGVTGGMVEKTYGDADFAYTATSNGDGEISYSSSDPHTASVDAKTGTVKILKAGGISAEGIATVTITATAAETESHAGASATYTLRISRKKITVDSIEMNDKVYDGTMGGFTVKNISLSDESLAEDRDYMIFEVFFNGETPNAGSYKNGVTVKVRLDENNWDKYEFEGEGDGRNAFVAADVKINPFALTNDNTTADWTGDGYFYTGTEIKPTATVKVDLDGDGEKETTLVAGTDYEISYADNINAGKATATISGKGNYGGTLSAFEFTIVPVDVVPTIAAISDMTYTGEALTPELIVTAEFGGATVTLEKDKDYTVSYSNNKDAGTATVKISPVKTSNFKFADDTYQTNFTIKQAVSAEPAEMSVTWMVDAGSTLADMEGERTAGFVWNDETTVIAAGWATYGATYTQNGDTKNYSSIALVVPVYGLSGETYEFVEGGGQEYQLNEDGTALFKVNADFSLFQEGGMVFMDGAWVDPVYYTATSGSTKLEFTEGYMSTLGVGEHTLAVLFNNGAKAETVFTVARRTADNPTWVEVSNSATTVGTSDTGRFTGEGGSALLATGTVVVAVVIVGAGYFVARRRSKKA
ncbi:hypothetical protein IKG60_00210 [Candidatus Saccharibacteria bacterium]|nr:hypothetical protein [Candidatus Saccharibacteria bacterium]